MEIKRKEREALDTYHGEGRTRCRQVDVGVPVRSAHARNPPRSSFIWQRGHDQTVVGFEIAAREHVGYVCPAKNMLEKMSTALFSPSIRCEPPLWQGTRRLWKRRPPSHGGSSPACAKTPLLTADCSSLLRTRIDAAQTEAHTSRQTPVAAHGRSRAPRSICQEGWFPSSKTGCHPLHPQTHTERWFLPPVRKLSPEQLGDSFRQNTQADQL
jgi:hypothetical protein